MKLQADYAETRDLTSEEYHAEREHDSNTTLRLFDRSPLEYYHVRVTGKRQLKETNPQRLGSLAHVLIIEPEKASQLIRVAPREILGKGEAKTTKAWDEFKAAHAKYICCTPQEYHDTLWQANNVHANPEVMKLLGRVTLREQSIFWSRGGWKMKCRLDLGCEFDAEIVDVKRTSKIDEFWRSVRDYGYDCQAAIYSDGYEALYGERPVFRFLLVSDNLCDSCIVTLPPEAIALGRQKNAETKRMLLECRSGQRPWIKEGYDQTRELELPSHFYPAEPFIFEGI